MGLFVDWLTIDCRDAKALAEFWNEALDYRTVYEDIDDVIKRRNVRAFEKTKDNKIKSANIEKKDNIKEIFVAVSDSGKGISPEILPRLFEKFNSNSAAGTGLGLYISKKLIEAMEGRIWAFNNADGKGSTFVFSLPKFDSSKL